MKKIWIIGTGGTIAGVGQTVSDARYRAGLLSLGALLESVPGLDEVAQVQTVSLASIGSQDMTEKLWLKLAAEVTRLQAQPDCDGIVIIHGTDTLEETAFFLDKVLPVSVKPVVLTGSMRPATAIGADGPRNIFAAVCVAASDASAARGVLVVFADTIHAATHVKKLDALGLEAFGSGEYGSLGRVYVADVLYHTPAPAPAPASVGAAIAAGGGGRLETLPISGLLAEPAGTVDLAALCALERFPKVGIVTAHVGESPELIEAMVTLGYRGIVYAGFGNGNFSAVILAALKSARASGLAVVRASRVPAGPVTAYGEIDDSEHGFIAAGALSPQKARLLLSLGLAVTSDVQKLRAFFG